MLTRMLAIVVKGHTEISTAVCTITRKRDLDHTIKLMFGHTLDEERLMQEVAHKDYAEHRKAHERLISSLKETHLDGSLAELRFGIGELYNKHVTKWDVPLLNSLEVGHG